MDKTPYFAVETGTWLTSAPNPHVALSGSSPDIGAYPARTFSATDSDTTVAFASGDLITVVVVKDSSNFKRYTGASWTSGSPATVSLATATLEGSAGAISNGDTVTVFAALPNDVESATVSDATIFATALANGAML